MSGASLDWRGLIVTVTEVESHAVMDVFREATGREARPELIASELYLDFGEINGSRVFMALSGMGSGGIGASQERVRKAIEALSPAAVIMIGIAFGINESKQAIGDVLVSERLMLYDLQRRGTNEADGTLHIIPRGDRPSSSPRLFNWFRIASLQWSQARVRLGLVLSGEHLIDNIDYRSELLALEEEAIGGEMEGAGLYVACQNNKIDWILVKGICDWADGNKEVDREARQKQAAHNAAAFMLHALQQAPRKQNRSETASRARIASEPRRPVASSLPTQPYFFGRERELAVIAEAVSPEARTWGVLIDGPGGIGKTALALVRTACTQRRPQYRAPFLYAWTIRRTSSSGSG